MAKKKSKQQPAPAAAVTVPAVVPFSVIERSLTTNFPEEGLDLCAELSECVNHHDIGWGGNNAYTFVAVPDFLYALQRRDYIEYDHVESLLSGAEYLDMEH